MTQCCLYEMYVYSFIITFNDKVLPISLGYMTSTARIYNIGNWLTFQHM